MSQKLDDNAARGHGLVDGRLGPLPQLISGLALGSFGVFALSFALVGLQANALVLTFAGYFAAAALTVGLLRRGYPHKKLGLANITTIFRMVLVGSLVAPTLAPANPWVLVLVATVALLLDGLDGWLARRQGAVSEFGARFDMEVDSALALVLALNVFASNNALAWVVLLALPRYAFIAAARFLPWLNRPLVENYSRKVVCVIQVAALIALNAPIFPSWLLLPTVLTVAGALLWSFGRDIVWLWRSRP